jgi:hypothetical protein
MYPCGFIQYGPEQQKTAWCSGALIVLYGRTAHCLGCSRRQGTPGEAISTDFPTRAKSMFWCAQSIVWVGDASFGLHAAARDAWRGPSSSVVAPTRGQQQASSGSIGVDSLHHNHQQEHKLVRSAGAAASARTSPWERRQQQQCCCLLLCVCRCRCYLCAAAIRCWSSTHIRQQLVSSAVQQFTCSCHPAPLGSVCLGAPLGRCKRLRGLRFQN